MTPLTRHSAIRRSGFSLIEMITAILAATALMSALAASVVISTNLLEAPPDEQRRARDRLIQDRLRNDLRYATSIKTKLGSDFQIQRPHPTTGISETVSYRGDQNGFTRQVADGPLATLDENPPQASWSVFGYSAPDESAPTLVVRIRSTSQASTVVRSSQLDVPVPAGLKQGDRIVLCLSAITPDSSSAGSIAFSEPDWHQLQLLRNENLNLGVFHHSYDDSWPSSLRVSISPASVMAGLMLAIENVDQESPANWTKTTLGHAVADSPGTHPTYSQPDTLGERNLNLQIFAAQGAPWNEGRLGMTGFCDVLQLTAGLGTASEHSIAVLTRNGLAPELSFTPRLMHQQPGNWIGLATAVEASK